MSNLSVGQILLDAQRVASRVKDLDALGNALLVEAEGNNRLVESLRQFQDDLESLNRISSNKSNAEIINRIQQQNAQSSEILKENRELKICLEDYEYAMELLMQKYRQHMTNKVMESKINFREAYNDKLWNIIRQQREKINEMAAVMQRCATMDDDEINKDLETMTRLRMENKTLRELLQISKQGAFGLTTIRPNDHLLVDQGIQTEINEMLCDELAVSTTWADNFHNNNNNTVIETTVKSVITEKNDNDNNANNDVKDIKEQINITANIANFPNLDDNNFHNENKINNNTDNVQPLNTIKEIVIKNEDIMLQDNNNASVEPIINNNEKLSLVSASNADNTSNVNNNNISTTVVATNNNANDQLSTSSSSSSSTPSSSSSSTALIKSET